jgi:hypothetical protein
MNGDDLRAYLEALVRETPLYAVLFAAIIFVIARSDRHPGATFWAAFGFGWLLLFGLIAALWREFRLYEIVIPNEIADAPGEDFEGLVDALSCAFFSAIQAIGYVFLLVAICVGRPRRTHAYPAHPDDHNDHGPT